MKYSSKIRKSGNGHYISIPPEILEPNLELGSFLQLEVSQKHVILHSSSDDLHKKIVLKALGGSIVMPIPFRLRKAFGLYLGQSVLLEKYKDGFILEPVEYSFDIHPLLDEQKSLKLEKNSILLNVQQGDIVLCSGQYFVVLTSEQFNKQLQSLIAIPFENLNISMPNNSESCGFICIYKFRNYNVIRIDKPQSLPLDSIQVVDAVPKAIRNIVVNKFSLVTHT